MAHPRSLCVFLPIFSTRLRMMKSSTRPLPSQWYQMMFPRTAWKTTLPTTILSLAVTVMLHWGRLLRVRRMHHLDSYSIHPTSPTTEMRLVMMMMTVQCLHRRHQSPRQLQTRSLWSRYHLPAFNTNKITLNGFWRQPNPAARTIVGSVRRSIRKEEKGSMF